MDSKIVYILPGTMCTGIMFTHLRSALTNAGFTSKVIQFTTEKSINDMVSLCKKQATSPGIFLGFSMGGIVALALAKQYPELISKLILMSSNSFADLPGKNEIRQQHISKAKQDGLDDVIKHDFKPLYLYKENLQHQQLILAMAQELGFNCFESQLPALSTRTDSLHLLQTFKQPVLIIAGENDKLCQVQEQQKMHNACANSELILLTQCGHFPTLEQTEKTSKSILTWLKQSGST
ncbi:alpha/beta fold hydrolase [Thalassomonas sp. M1454]|uniref:alpha/beta fold hydrolase n=1 Tax=Thalassomonas sp. M1454 TaxID=2594477 RepID=UPI00117F4430|nr:alpha/beta hydrolase [Thalassomonas sp. M1454]TRX56771.1 alpha/beta hydrolase [Thalassomonas sp. M1454]